MLGEEQIIRGDLRIDLWTNKGNRDLVFTQGEEMQLYLRVNQPAWVRLVYILSSGDHVPMEQAYYIDSEKVNFKVEYPDSFAEQMLEYAGLYSFLPSEN